jgi:PTS system ascorbate-specific IIA component
MTVSILLITHNGLGTALLDAATKTYNSLPLPVQAVSVDYDVDPTVLIPKLRELTRIMDFGAGVLVLTDIMGATPSNLAQIVSDDQQIYVVAGLTLPMLLSVLDDPSFDLIQLAQKALSSGRDGVCQCVCPTKQSTDIQNTVL